MRRRLAVAAAALIAAVALAGAPAPADSTSPAPLRDVQPAAFEAITVPLAGSSAGDAAPESALRSDGFVTGASAFTEPGRKIRVPRSRPDLGVPSVSSQGEWKKPRYTITGTATFYDNGTTAMRLPRGTVIRVCGKGGCIERVVTDYGPQSSSRIIDLYRPDFFDVCGCASWSGTTTVTVSVY